MGKRSHQVIAIWVAIYFVVAVPTLKVVLAVLLMLIVVGDVARGIPRAQLTRILLVVGIGVGLVLAYGITGGETTSDLRDEYILTGLKQVLSWSATAAVAFVYFRPSCFNKILWKFAVASSAFALTVLAANLIYPMDNLVSLRGSTARLQGLLSEPSAWAPVAAYLALASWRRHSIAGLVLTGGVIVFASSPTVYIVSALSILLYAILVSRGARRIKSVTVAAIVLGLSVVALSSITASESPSSESNRIAAAINRLIGGVGHIQSGGRFGVNDRYQSTEVTIREVALLNREIVGLGVGADAVYFQDKFPVTETRSSTPLPNAIWVSTYFNHGALGASVLLLLTVLSLLRIRRSADLLVLFIPFTTAAWVNSAQGDELFKWTILLVLLGIFGGPKVGEALRQEAALGRRCHGRRTFLSGQPGSSTGQAG